MPSSPQPGRVAFTISISKASLVLGFFIIYDSVRISLDTTSNIVSTTIDSGPPD
jgi:hypothetical protein